MQRTLKRELKSTWNCWNGSEGNQCLLVHISLATCGLGAVNLREFGLVESFGRAQTELMFVASTGFDWCRRNGFLYPVLKHGPRSLTYVRVQGCQTPVRNESDSGWIFLHNPPASILRENGLSVSIHVGTRKMVNYAWIGWSQGKLWWKPVAILTCKSIVKFGYRGERLIEPSSSWFPPKFPSG